MGNKNTNTFARTGDTSGRENKDNTVGIITPPSGDKHLPLSSNHAKQKRESKAKQKWKNKAA